jgi:hypothetical protein
MKRNAEREHPQRPATLETISTARWAKEKVLVPELII